MATNAPKFQQPEIIPTPNPPNYHPKTTVSPPSHDGLHFYQFMIAGSIAGMVEHMSMFPIDTIKTQMQTLNSCPIKSVSIQQALTSILRSQGPTGLYRGITAMGLGAGPAHAVYFSVYENCKTRFLGRNYNDSLVHALSGVFATVASDAVFTPMDVVKQRLQMRNSPYSGVLDCVRRVFREEGFKGFYASYRPTVLMNAPFTAVHFATYEAVKKGLIDVSVESGEDESFVVHATAGAAAGAVAAAFTTPLDVVKTQLQCQGVCGCDRFISGSITDVIRTIIKKDGYHGLMRGWVPRMLFHAPAAAICWSTYEAGKSFFQEANSSSRSSSSNTSSVT